MCEKPFFISPSQFTSTLKAIRNETERNESSAVYDYFGATSSVIFSPFFGRCCCAGNRKSDYSIIFCCGCGLYIGSMYNFSTDLFKYGAYRHKEGSVVFDYGELIKADFFIIIEY